MTAAIVACGAILAGRGRFGASGRLIAGVLAVGVLLALEALFLALVLGEPVAPLWTSLDPRTGNPFLLGLLVMAIGPMLFAGGRRS